jgi:uncharacterized membrane protein YfcA
MEILLGFAIAVAIGLTGVGGGVLTAPLLIVCLGMPATQAVGTALLFVAAVKIFAVPVYLYRRQVDWRTLASMLAGGVPGVVAGSLLLRGAGARGLNSVVLGAVGLVVAVSASLTLWRTLCSAGPAAGRNRFGALGAASSAIGVEVGFSSAGAGALGTVALFQLTSLPAAEVVGTDLVFGFVLSLIGGGFHLAAGTYDPGVAARLIGGGLAGAVAGAYLASVVPARALRIAIALLLVGLGGELGLRALGSLWAR